MKRNFSEGPNPNDFVLIQKGRIIERRRFSRELHDGLSQELLAIRFQTQVMEKMCDDAKTKKMIQQMNEQVFQAIATLKGIVKSGIPDEILSLRFDLVLQRKLKLDCPIEIKIDGSASLVFRENGIAIEVLRVVQEFVQNAIKHAKATRIDVKLCELPKGIRVHLRDNGVGFNMDEETPGMGIRNIHFRLKLIQANYSYTSSKNQGTQLQIEAYEKRH